MDQKFKQVAESLTAIKEQVAKLEKTIADLRAQIADKKEPEKPSPKDGRQH